MGIIALGVLSSIFVSKTFPFQTEHSNPIAGLSLPSVAVVEPEDPVLTSAVLPQTVERGQVEAALGISSGDGSAQVTVTAETEAPPLYRRYTAQTGDTASSIAERFGTSLQYLLWNNPELHDSDVLAVGDVLFLPAGEGILHYVAYGETLGGIAAFYDVAQDPIVGWAGNKLASPDQIVDGQLLFVPNGVMPAPSVPEPAAVTTLTGAAHTHGGVIWPYACSLSRGIGGGHAGIDIQGKCNSSAAIAAATNGTVYRAGGDACCGYGLFVDIMSPEGILTRYAHLSSIFVSVGQPVSQGQSLGIIGDTGNSRGTHLHFEVWTNWGSTLVNPLNYLP